MVPFPRWTKRSPETVSGYSPDGGDRSAREEPTSEIGPDFSRRSRFRSVRLEHEATDGADHQSD